MKSASWLIMYKVLCKTTNYAASESDLVCCMNPDLEWAKGVFSPKTKVRDGFSSQLHAQ